MYRGFSPSESGRFFKHWRSRSCVQPTLGTELQRPFAGVAVRASEAGDLTAGETPVPIPNTEVKPRWADCTARESVWESRSSPT